MTLRETFCLCHKRAKSSVSVLGEVSHSFSTVKEVTAVFFAFSALLFAAPSADSWSMWEVFFLTATAKPHILWPKVSKSRQQDWIGLVSVCTRFIWFGEQQKEDVTISVLDRSSGLASEIYQTRVVLLNVKKKRQRTLWCDFTSCCFWKNTTCKTDKKLTCWLI